jgi:hypothetical protein
MLSAPRFASMLMPWFAGVMPLAGRPHGAGGLSCHAWRGGSWLGGARGGRWFVAGRFVAGRFAAALIGGHGVARKAAILTGHGLARPGWRLVVYALQAR